MTTAAATDEDIEKVILDIYRRDGVCSPEAFVAEASDPSSPIHALFDWDDETAAHRWRLHRARTILGRFTIKIDDSRAPAYVSLSIDRDGQRRRGYVPTLDAMNDDEKAAQVLHDAAAGLSGWRRRLASFKQAEAAIKHLDSAIETLREGTA
jgi:hypothetical protein